MDLTHRFTVPAPIDQAWTTFNDLERITPCFPGATLTSYDGESFEGVVKIKLGPISLQYTGSGRFLDRDLGAHRAVIEANGRDKRGNGTAAASITATLEAAAPGSTDVVVATQLHVTGKPAQFGRGVMQDVSDKLLGQFASCLETKLGQPTVQAGADATVEHTGTERSGAEPAAAVGAVSPGAPAAAAGSARAGRIDAGSGGTGQRLDLGATVLPVLAKRYGPVLLGGLAALWLLRKVSRRS